MKFRNTSDFLDCKEGASFPNLQKEVSTTFLTFKICLQFKKIYLEEYEK